MKPVIYAVVFVLNALAGISQADEITALARKGDCFTCHSVDQKNIGPSFKEISEKYKNATEYVYRNKTYPLETGLARKIAGGGMGNWGTLPMPPNSAVVNDDETRILVRYILSETGIKHDVSSADLYQKK